MIGRFGGARLSDFLTMIGADTSARFITVACADDYYESLDMATALHPQTLLCYEMYDQPLTRETRRAAAAEYPDKNWIQAGEVLHRSEGHQRSRKGRLLGRSGIFVVLRAVSDVDLMEMRMSSSGAIEIERSQPKDDETEDRGACRV